MKIKFLTIFVLLIISSLQVLAYDPNYKDYTIKNQWYQATFDESGAATVYVALNIFNNPLIIFLLNIETFKFLSLIF